MAVLSRRGVPSWYRGTLWELHHIRNGQGLCGNCRCAVNAACIVDPPTTLLLCLLDQPFEAGTECCSLAFHPTQMLFGELSSNRLWWVGYFACIVGWVRSMEGLLATIHLRSSGFRGLGFRVLGTDEASSRTHSWRTWKTILQMG